MDKAVELKNHKKCNESVSLRRYNTVRVSYLSLTELPLPEKNNVIGPIPSDFHEAFQPGYEFIVRGSISDLYTACEKKLATNFAFPAKYSL